MTTEDEHLWDQDYVNAEESGHFTFETKGMGRVHFGYVQAQLDWRYDPGVDQMDFSFEGSCEGDEMTGTGGVDYEQIAYEAGPSWSVLQLAWR